MQETYTFKYATITNSILIVYYGVVNMLKHPISLLFATYKQTPVHIHIHINSTK